jgi:2-hydroxy-6-oxonona-2,4-dienedioate hydrolase
MSMGVPPKWIDVDGLRTRYFEAGAGEPILFITGGNFGTSGFASIVETWNRNLVPLGDAGYRAIAVDKIGQGFTDNPPDDDYTMRAVIAHLIGFMNALDLRNAHVVGQSRGALPAAALMRECAHRIKSCTIVNTSSLAPGVSMNEVNLAGSPYPPFTREAHRWIFERCAFRPESVDDNYVEAGYEVFQSAKYRESVAAVEGRGLRRTLFMPDLARVRADVLHWLETAGIGRPTQVVWGFNDRSASFDRGRDLFERIASRERRASFHLINEAGHNPYRERPEQFNAIMASFLEALR